MPLYFNFLIQAVNDYFGLVKNFNVLNILTNFLTACPMVEWNRHLSCV